jgi:Ankyrin repeat
VLAVAVLTSPFWLPLGPAYAATPCSFEAFREAMAYQREAELDALIGLCRREGRWPEREDGASLLHLAAHVGGRQAGAYTRRLLAAGLKPDTVTRDRHDPVTPLAMAVRFNCADCVQALLTAGAPLGAPGAGGMTLLHEAGAATVPLLIAAGLDPAARDAQGNVPLHRVWHPALLAVGIDVVNAAGITPLHVAALGDELPRVEALLAAGANPALRTTADTHWRLSSMSAAFGPGLPVPKGSTAYDLARQRYQASRWSTQTHEATMKRLEGVTPRRGWLGR